MPIVYRNFWKILSSRAVSHSSIRGISGVATGSSSSAINSRRMSVNTVQPLSKLRDICPLFLLNEELSPFVPRCKKKTSTSFPY